MTAPRPGRTFAAPQPLDSRTQTEMPDKVVINLATGLEDPERVTIAFLIAGAAQDQDRPVAMFVTKQAARDGTPLWQWVGDGSATVLSS